MPRKVIDEKGKRYGLLVVGEQCGRHDDSFHVMWNCHCDCGNEKAVSANKLRTGQVKSCGCLRTSLGKALMKKLKTNG